MSPITTHVLDTSLGRPAQGVEIILEIAEAKSIWKVIASKTTNHNGRVSELLAETKPLEKGTYRMIFKTGNYFKRRRIDCFYPEVIVIFKIAKSDEHYHVPLLLSPFGYSTYRGS